MDGNAKNPPGKSAKRKKVAGGLKEQSKRRGERSVFFKNVKGQPGKGYALKKPRTKKRVQNIWGAASPRAKLGSPNPACFKGGLAPLAWKTERKKRPGPCRAEKERELMDKERGEIHGCTGW